MVQTMLQRGVRAALVGTWCPARVNPLQDVKIGGSLGCSDHALVKFAVLRNMGQVKNKVRPLNLRKANFQLFKDIVNRIPWETALRDKVTEQSWQIFKDVFQRAQELVIPRHKKSSKEGKRPVWLSRELLVKLQGKKQMNRRWKTGQVTWEEYRNKVWLCRDGVRKAKAKLELILARDTKNNRKGFYSSKWPVRKSNREWILKIDYCGLNEVTPPLSTAVLDMQELQYELESKAAKWYHNGYR
ncbi:hypothetical protein BTVI_29644 [Pitangus sulphuratus]|nr:hypothetical protein BTVI_29644 [Pitangus sulphuratus]